MRNVSDKFVEKIKTHILCSVIFFHPENRAVYEIMWEKYYEFQKKDTNDINGTTWLPHWTEFHEN